MKYSPKALRSMKGFTLIELMIVIAIIGILAAIAIPSYQQYTRKSKFTEVVVATSPYKLAVELCFQDGFCEGAGPAVSVAAGTGRWNGQIPDDSTTAKNFVASVAVGTAGVITATSVAGEGLNSSTYILTPTVAGDNGLTWAKTGTCTASPAIC